MKVSSCRSKLCAFQWQNGHKFPFSEGFLFILHTNYTEFREIAEQQIWFFDSPNHSRTTVETFKELNANMSENELSEEE